MTSPPQTALSPDTQPLLRCEIADGVATLSLCNGKVNAISPALVEAWQAALDRAEAEQAVVVITGQPGVFSGGFDLKVMKSDPRAALDLVTAGFSLARRLLSHPRPVLMACSGHAVAMGAFLLLAADYRIGAQGAFTIALNEVRIGMTMPHTGLALAHDRLSPAAFQRAVLLSETFTPEGAQQAGFLDQVVPAGSLMETALSLAAQFKTLDATAHHQSKLRARQALLERLDAATVQDRALLAQSGAA